MAALWHQLCSVNLPIGLQAQTPTRLSVHPSSLSVYFGKIGIRPKGPTGRTAWGNDPRVKQPGVLEIPFTILPLVTGRNDKVCYLTPGWHRDTIRFTIIPKTIARFHVVHYLTYNQVLFLPYHRLETGTTLQINTTMFTVFSLVTDRYDWVHFLTPDDKCVPPGSPSYCWVTQVSTSQLSYPLWHESCHTNKSLVLKLSMIVGWKGGAKVSCIFWQPGITWDWLTAGPGLLCFSRYWKGACVYFCCFFSHPLFLHSHLSCTLLFCTAFTSFPFLL